jgi:hypothetical protein
LLVERWRQTAAVSGAWCGFGGGAVAGFTALDVEFNSGNIWSGSAQSSVRLLDTTTQVYRTKFGSCYFQSAGDRNAPIFHQGNGKVRTVIYDNCEAYGTGTLFFNSTGATESDTGVGITIQVSNHKSRHTSSWVSPAVNLKYNVQLSNVRGEDTGINILQPTVGTYRVSVSGFQHVNESTNANWGFDAGANNFFYAGAGTAIFSVNGRECPIDPAAYGGANNVLTPKLGDQIWNSNVGAGTWRGTCEWNGTNWVNLLTGATA